MRVQALLLLTWWWDKKDDGGRNMRSCAVDAINTAQSLGMHRWYVSARGPLVNPNSDNQGPLPKGQRCSVADLEEGLVDVLCEQPIMTRTTSCCHNFPACWWFSLTANRIETPSSPPVTASRASSPSQTSTYTP